MSTKIFSGNIVARINKRTERGFTLIEITIAVLVLSGAFVVLLGLQASATQRAVRDRNSQSAMLLARRILAAIETTKDPQNPGVQDEEANKLLVKVMPGLNDNSPELEATKNFMARLVVEEWPVGEEKDAMLRLSLTISWSDSKADSFYVTYFMPKAEEDDQDPIS